jgi:hypothetical protein
MIISTLQHTWHKLFCQVNAESSVTVRLAGNRAGREVKLEGIHPDMEVEMLLRRACNTFGVNEGATIALRIKTRLLGAEETLAQAGTSTMDVT